MSFESDIMKWAEKMGKGFDEVVTAVLFQTSSAIAVGTPVLTGRARGNWFANVGAPKEGVTDNTKVDFTNIEKTAFESVGSIFYFTNNLPYIGRLEFDSHSKQAPAGMVRVAIENFQQQLTIAVGNLD